MTFYVGDIVEGFDMGSMWDGIRIRVTRPSPRTTYGVITFLTKHSDTVNNLGGGMTFYTSKCKLIEAAPKVEPPKIRKNRKIFAEEGWGP